MRHVLLCALCFLIPAALGSCGSAGGATTSRDSSGAFSAVLDQQASVGVEGASVALQPVAGSSTTFDLVATGLTAATAVVGTVRYDNAVFHLNSVDSSATAVGADGRLQGGSSELLLVCLESVRDSEVQFNLSVARPDVNPALSGEVTLARLSFASGAVATRVAAKAPSGPFNTFTIAGSVNANGEPVLTWQEAHAGDGDNNGEVNGSDLTPIALSFQDTTNAATPNQARDADYDRNGEVFGPDITVIAQNFQATLKGYAIFAGPNAGSLAEVFRLDRNVMFPTAPNTTTGIPQWSWTGPVLTVQTVFQVRPYDNAGALGLASDNTVTLDPPVTNPTITGIDEITFVGAESWPTEDGDYIVILTENAVNDVVGDEEGIGRVLEELQLVGMVTTDQDPGPVDGTASLVWRLVDGGGLATIGNGGTGDPKGLLDFVDRGRIEVEARLVGSFTETESIGFKLYSIQSLALTTSSGNVGPVSVGSGQEVQFKVDGTFDWNGITDGDELVRDMLPWVNWAMLADDANTGSFSVDVGLGKLATGTANSGDMVRVVVEFPKTDDVTLYDNQKKSSEFLEVNIT